MNTNRAPNAAPDGGFSLVEMLVVVTLASLIMGMSVVSFQAAARQLRYDSNVRIIQWQLHTAREMAMSQRRDVRVQFLAPRGISAIRKELPTGTTLLSTVYLEGNGQFWVFPGVPDTPDGFGNQQALAFGDATELMFTSEGAFVDQAGRAVNGSIFFGVPTQTVTARAITIFGPTGRVRSYRWQGGRWSH